jgi:hypothetical protein
MSGQSHTAERGPPRPAVERANAAYVWVKECQSELVSTLQGENAGFGSGWVEIQWRFRRLEAAVAAMDEAEATSKAEGRSDV